MCYESWYQKKPEMNEREKAKQDADAMIEQARAKSHKPKLPVSGESQPVAETEEAAT